MATSTKTFDQVKSILGKLDQRIDALRSQRITGQSPAPAAPAVQPTASGAARADAMTDGPNLSTVIGASSHDRVNAPTPAKPTTTPPGPIPMADATPRPNATQSKYGRATPLRNIG